MGRNKEVYGTYLIQTHYKFFIYFFYQVLDAQKISDKFLRNPDLFSIVLLVLVTTTTKILILKLKKNRQRKFSQ